jgi:DNA (cytosine-5)-methyltransferase 3A
MNVLSLFNGMNTGRQALENIGIKVNKYYSSEIKLYAIQLTQHHFPDTIQVGDITNWRSWDIDWKTIDLVLSGSPCQDLSAAGKRAGINGDKSSLFFVFVDILNHIKTLNPNVLFLQENVGSASKLDVGIMSRALGVYPVRINSKLVTAQLRDRYYWSNIRTKHDGIFGDIVTDIPQPKDRGIMFKDIITDGRVEKLKTGCLMESISRVQHTYKGITSREKFGVPIIYVETGKPTCLNTKSGSMQNSKQEYLLHRYKTTGMITIIQENLKVRTVNQIEMERLQGFPDGYTSILSTAKAGSLLGDGWTLPVIEHIFSFIN